MFIFLHIISCILYNPKAWFFLYFIFVDEDFCSCSYEVNNFTCPAVNLTSGETITLDNVYPVDSWVRLKKIPVEAHPGCGVDFLIGTECMPVKEKYSEVCILEMRVFWSFFGHFWSFLAFPGHFWSFLVIFGHFWPFLAFFT